MKVVGTRWFGPEVHGYPVWTSLCVGIGIDDDGGSLRDWLWQEIGGETFEEEADVTQNAQYLHGVHFSKVGRDSTFKIYEDRIVDF